LTCHTRGTFSSHFGCHKLRSSTLWKNYSNGQMPQNRFFVEATVQSS